ncbi:MAG: hypothetical protein A2V77_07925 [Anaeromyxobacter sp. RBG_16_69_14]|nr:MAG: hypothetical protein A2V77_07925 [Anaeromyxobacter sp. RBG_16_69_14]
MATRPNGGCLVCGEELIYLAVAELVRCAHCDVAASSAARCPAGHYICDGCHSGSAKDVIESVCAATEEQDPIAIARALMRHPALELHGPEHHFLVPAALLAAFSNVRSEGDRRAGRVAEARRRSEPIAGGFCGLQGACGAGIGAGTFVAIVTGSSPLRGAERGLANRMTAEALAIIGATNGPRCCKRDSSLAILAAARFAREHLGVYLPVLSQPCQFSERNRQCAGEACPFHPLAAPAT